jgi:UDP-3-O-[3-hydroxymyristoyl] N-acetylglucosamine deacetylase
MKYKKLFSQIEIEGVGIHTGKFSKIKLKPTDNSSINFVSNDNTFIEPILNNVVDTTQATSLGNKNIKILTVEHLLAAIYCLYINNIEIYVDGKEIPAMDGSAAMFVEKILSAGLIETDKEINFVTIDKPFKINIDKSSYEILPSQKFIISCKIVTTRSKYLNNKEVSVEITPENFISQIAYAKTFCLLEDVEKIRSKGLGQGGSLNNVIIIDDDKVVNPEILKYKDDEPVRHKILDFLGDLALTNIYFKGEFKIINPSHYTNIEFGRHLLKTIYS